jgi:hypothetical protein
MDRRLGSSGSVAAPEMDRCSSCGGLNAPGADWCGQCLRRFTPPEASSPEQSRPGPGTPSAAEMPAVRASGKSGAFRIDDRGVSWTCARCETVNDLRARVCSVCGTAFAETIKEPEPPVVGDPNKAVLYSLFYPGAGHAFLGLWSQAVARAVMSTWVVAVMMFAAFQKGVPGAAIIAVLFGLSSFALWACAAHDAYREATHESGAVILKGRSFLWVTIGLLGLLFASLMVAGFTAQRSL